MKYHFFIYNFRCFFGYLGMCKKTVMIRRVDFFYQKKNTKEYVPLIKKKNKSIVFCFVYIFFNLITNQKSLKN